MACHPHVYKQGCEMKAYISIVLLILSGCLSSITRTVALDGSQQYTTIQAAVNASEHGDTVLVYPGRYIENVITIGINITIASLYSVDPLQQYIENTIIDGNLGTCIRIDSGEAVTINGFTLVNNENNVLNSPSNPGGGMFVNSSMATVENTIIRNCIAQAGGGIAAGAGSTLSLSNVRISNNQALNLGGGLAVDQSTGLNMSQSNPCSIFNNNATRGMDISISFNSSNPTPIEINLALGSTVLTEADGYFIHAHRANVTVNIAQGTIEQIDHDLYVAPDGDDSNSGLDSGSSLRTIAIAMQRIASNPDNPKTIHLAPGIYSHSANGQILPMGVKSNVKVQGAGIGETIIDGELSRTFWGAWYASNIEISGMKLMNGRSIYAYVFCFFYGNNAYIHDVEFYNNYGSLLSGMIIAYSSDVRIENSIIGNVNYPNDLNGIWVSESSNLFINNTVVTGNTTTDSESNHMGMKFYDSDIHLRNSIVSNISAVDAWVFFYQTIYEPFAAYNLDMSNVLIFNNSVSNPSWVSSPIYIQNRYQPVQINNCTIANNNVPGYLCRILAGADLRNVIFHNPGSGSELGLMNYLSVNATAYPVSISNSLFRTATVPSSRPELLTLTDNIMSADPMFLGTVDTSLGINQPEYYQLSALSPCIDSGTPDTEGLNLPPMDLAGNYRIANGRIDMGVYEYASEPWVSTDDPEVPPLPEGFKVSAYPNPLLNTSRAAGVFLEFTLPKKPEVPPVIEIFNIRGQKVKTIRLTESYNSLVSRAGLSHDVKQSGEFYSTVWNGRDDDNRPLASGTYIVKAITDRNVATTKITIIK